MKLISPTVIVLAALAVTPAAFAQDARYIEGDGTSTYVVGDAVITSYGPPPVYAPPISVPPVNVPSLNGGGYGTRVAEAGYPGNVPPGYAGAGYGDVGAGYGGGYAGGYGGGYGGAGYGAAGYAPTSGRNVNVVNGYPYGTTLGGGSNTNVEANLAANGGSYYAAVARSYAAQHAGNPPPAAFNPGGGQPRFNPAGTFVRRPVRGG